MAGTGEAEEAACLLDVWESEGGRSYGHTSHMESFESSLPLLKHKGVQPQEINTG